MNKNILPKHLLAYFIAFVSLFLALLVLPTSGVANAQPAAEQIRYTNTMTIEVPVDFSIEHRDNTYTLQSGTYNAQNHNESNRGYYRSGVAACGYIQVSDPLDSPEEITINLVRQGGPRGPGAGDTCRSTSLTLTSRNSQNASIWFRWLDSENVVDIRTNELYSLESNVFRKPGVQCSNELRITDGDSSRGRFTAITGEQVRRGGPGSSETETVCQEGDPRTIGLADTQYADAEPGQGADAGEFVTGDGNVTSCEDAGGLAWIFCAVVRVVSQAFEFVDNQMVNILIMDEAYFANEGLRNSWTVLRNIAYLLLVPAMLVMIISTALGFEFVNAYTVKTALPRMVAATIFIALSFDISVLIVDIVQSVGVGIHNILLLPFDDVDQTSTLASVLPAPETFTGSAALGGLAAWGAFAAGSAVWGGGLIMTLAGFIGLAALVMLFVLALLLIRQTLIVLLVLFSPIAILAWIFPGRTTIWKIWNKTFWLMMWFFPIIMATTAAGKIMAVLIRGI